MKGIKARESQAADAENPQADRRSGFRTRTRTTFPGFIGVTTADGVEIDGAVLLPEAKYVVLDVGGAATRRATAKTLGMSAQELFPLTYTLRVRVGRERELRTGLIQ